MVAHFRVSRRPVPHTGHAPRGYQVPGLARGPPPHTHAHWDVGIGVHEQQGQEGARVQRFALGQLGREALVVQLMKWVP